MTAMAAALKKAGIAILPASDRLNEIAEATLRQWPKDWSSLATVSSRDHLPTQLKELAVRALTNNARNWDGAKDAVLSAVRNDASLLWLLFEPYRVVAVEKLLTRVAAEMRAAQADGGHKPPTNHADRAIVGPFSGRKQNAPAEVPVQKEAVGPNEKRQPRAPRPAVFPTSMAAVANVARLSLLDTFKINNRAIGDCTSTEAMAWAGSRERDARFVRLLTQNLPPDRPIREFRRADEAQALYQRASEAADAA